MALKEEVNFFWNHPESEYLLLCNLRRA